MKNTTKQRIRNNTTNEYLLSGMLTCGHCGSKMIGRSLKSKNGNVNVRYGSSERKKNKNNCSKKDINRDRLEERVLNVLEIEFFNESVISDLADKIYNLYNEKINNVDDNVDNDDIIITLNNNTPKDYIGLPQVDVGVSFKYANSKSNYNLCMISFKNSFI